MGGKRPHAMDVARVQGRQRSEAVVADNTVAAVAAAAAADDNTAAKDGDGEHRRFVTALADRPRLAAPLSPAADDDNLASGAAPLLSTGYVGGAGGDEELPYLDLPVDDTQLLLRVDMPMDPSSEPVSPRPVSPRPVPAAAPWKDAYDAAQLHVDAIAEEMERGDGFALPAAVATATGRSSASASPSSSLPAGTGLPLASSVSVALLEKISRLPQRSSSASRAAAYGDYTAPGSTSLSGRCSRLPSLNEDEESASTTLSASAGGPGVLLDTSPDRVGATACRSSDRAGTMDGIPDGEDGGDDGGLAAADLEQLARPRGGGTAR